MSTITFYNVSDDEYPILEDALHRRGIVGARMVEESLCVENAARAADSGIVSVFAGSRVDAAVLDGLPELKLLTTRSTGYDHVDVETAARRGVAVCNVPDYGQNTVAEYAFGLLIALLRRIPPTLDRTAHGDFHRDGLMGSDLYGKVLGVIGTGRIGGRVAHYAHAFGMRVLAYDKFPNQTLCHSYNVRYMELDALLPQVDALTLHVPYDNSTRHLLDATRLRLMRPGTMLVNTARGGIVDSEALAQLHNEGHFGGLALDCFEGEEVWLGLGTGRANHFTPAQLQQALLNFGLLRHENVILTPHNAFNSRDAVQRIVTTTLDNIEGFLNGRPRNRVGPTSNPDVTQRAVPDCS